MNCKKIFFVLLLSLGLSCSMQAKKESSVKRHSPIGKSGKGVQNQNSGKQLLDFIMKPAPWLKKYPSIKKEVDEIIAKTKNEIQTDAESLFKEFPKSALLPFEVNVTELKLFEPNNKDIVSVRMTIYVYSGGAHGGKRYYTWNWSKKQNRFLFLNEIITKDKFPQFVSKARELLIRKQSEGFTPQELQEELQERSWINTSVERGTKRLEDFGIWNLHKENIIIMFPEYQVGPYSAGSFEVSIPL